MATTKITSPDLFDLGSLNTALKLPSGTTAERPTSPSTGEWRYNTTTNLVEFWDGGAWRDLQSEDIPPVPSENFNTVLYTGNGSTQSITGVGFQPDFVWVKVRSTTGSGPLADSTRGTGKAMYSNLTDADYTFSAGQGVTSFDADGFSIGDDSTGNGGYNGNGKTYVAWCWKVGGGTTSSNTDGTITSTVQANTKAGFSVVSYTGNAVSGATIGHGLGVEPDLVIVKSTNLTTQSWNTYVKNVTTTNAQFLTLNTNNANGNTANPRFIPGNFSSSVFSVGNDNSTNGVNGVDTYISYCFASVAGYSKIGSYTGNGSASGPIVNTGFEVGWILIKNTTSAGESWIMFDNARNTSNPRNCQLRADTNGVEACTVDTINFYANGFQPLSNWGGYNASGDTYIYMAFAADASAAPTLPDSFANKLYTGTNATNSITGLGFSPSLSWFKSRSNATSNVLHDTVRGGLSRIFSDSTAAASTIADGFVSFDSDGFTLDGTGSGGDVNGSGRTYVAWNWKANSIPTINTDGTTQSVVSANQAAGFSIIQYTGTGADATVGHGLSSAPNCIITKRLDATEGWLVWFSSLPASNYMYLNSSGIGGTDTNAYKTISSTTNKIGSDGTVNASGGEYISYVFHSVSGFSKMGTYTGTGATHAITGVGFQPDWIIGKETDGVDSWEMVDSARGINKMVYANGNNAEVTNTNFTSFDSDGFTLSSATSINQSGQTYIYMAFKENPTPRPLAGNMSFLTIAGGGGGGNRHAGGGGAGGLRTSYGGSSGGGSSSESDITLAAGTYTITVGGGGAGVAYNTTAGVNGTNSVLSGSGMTTITSDGGGGGGISISPNIAGSAGGSGGGGGSTSTGGSATANQGKDGGQGTGQTAPDYGGGGGGGATLIGNNGSGSGGGNGGNGLAVSITGASVAYAGGGGGSSFTNQSARGLGGTGGGGDGAANLTTGQSGTANLGGGGGGTTYDGGFSGAGGAGVVILRLKTSEYSSSTTGSPTVTTDGDYTVLTYTGSGTYVHS